MPASEARRRGGPPKERTELEIQRRCTIAFLVVAFGAIGGLAALFTAFVTLL
ncbi:MAG: hypothetical protein ACODAU_07990 [Myxococcota bacterium]